MITGKDSKTILRPEREAPTRPAYDAIQLALADPMRKNAEQIDIAPSSQGLATKYTVDGVSYDGPALEPTAGAAGISMLKAAAGMDVNERRKPQSGPLKASAWGRKMDLKLQSAGSTAGEYLRMLIDPKSRHGLRLEQMGLPADTQAAVMETVKGRTGIVLVAAPKGQGMTSMLYAILRAHDAFIEHIHSIEHDPDLELEGITQNKLAGNVTPADEAKQVDWVTSQEPDVIAMNKLEKPAVGGIAAQLRGEREDGIRGDAGGEHRRRAEPMAQAGRRAGVREPEAGHLLARDAQAVHGVQGGIHPRSQHAPQARLGSGATSQLSTRHAKSPFATPRPISRSLAIFARTCASRAAPASSSCCGWMTR